MLTPDPSYGIDVLYIVIGAALGFNAYGERKLLGEPDEEATSSYRRAESSSDSDSSGGGGSGRSSTSSSSSSSEQ